MSSIAMDVIETLSQLSSQSLQQSTLASTISHLLAFFVIFLSVVLLHDAMVRNKQLNASWWSLMSARQLHGPPSPPGPWWNLPLLGYLPWLGSKPYVTMWNLSRRYGSVYQIRFGGRKVLVLNGRDTIRAAFLQQGDTFAGRPDFSSFAMFADGKSLAFNSLDDDWNIQHKMSLRVLGMFGCGKNNYPVEALIHRHVGALVARLLHDSTPVGDGQAPAGVDPYGAVQEAVVSILFELCFGVDGDKELQSQVMQNLHAMRDVVPATQTVDVMPWMAPLSRGPLRRYSSSLLRVHQLITNKMDAIVSAGVPDTPACIVHALHHACSTSGVNDLQRGRMMASVQDIIGAGGEVGVYVIHWAILYAAKYPNLVQQRVRDEIGRTVGWKSAPVAADRGRMPYTEACVWEIIRHSCVSPLSIPHAAVRDAVIAGYRVPAGTVVLANLYSIGWDPDVWGDPAEFRPERFLTPDGSHLNRETVNQFMCFGTGRRRCLGAQFSQLQTFLIFVILMQRCIFSTPPGHELPSDATFVFSNRVNSYRVLVKATANVDNDDSN